MNDIQEQIAKLYDAGYSNRDIYDTLVYLDKMEGEVVSSGMAAFFDQKYKEEKEKYEQQRAEMQKKHDAILGNGYDLKKKRFTVGRYTFGIFWGNSRNSG